MVIERKKRAEEPTRYLRPDELKPTEPEPPRRLILAAMRDLPSVLKDMYQFPGCDNTVKLVGLLEERGHFREVSRWAIYEHLKAGRIRIAVKTHVVRHCLTEHGERIDGEIGPDDEVIEMEEEYQMILGTPEVQAWWEAELSKGESSDPQAEQIPFVPTPLQKEILKALDGTSLKKQPLADRVCKGDGSALYKHGDLQELRDRGKVDWKSRVGFFRPDATPPQNAPK